MVGGVERAANRATGRKLNRLLTLQVGAGAGGFLDGECDTLICALQLITNLTKVNKLVNVMRELAASRNLEP